MEHRFIYRISVLSYMNKWFKLSLVGLSAIGISVLSYTALSYFDVIGSKPDGYTTFLQSPKYQVNIQSPISSEEQEELNLDSLVINTTDTIRTVIQKDESEGIKDLQSIIANAVYEEAWAYTPSDSTWHETGISQLIKNRIIRLDDSNELIIVKPEPSASLVRISDHIKTLFKLYDEIVDYHLHPLPDQEIKDEAESDNAEDLQTAREKLYVTKARPSYLDLLSMIALSHDFYTENPDGNISFKIASPLGITEYSLTEKGRNIPDSQFYDSLENFRSIFRPNLDHLSDPIIKVHEIFDAANKQEIIRFSFQPYE